MRTKSCLVASALLAVSCPAIRAAHPTVAFVKKDVQHRTLVFSVHNGERNSITVCLSNQLTMGLPPSDHLELAPIYWEKFERGKWNTMIGSAVALGLLDELNPGQTEEFTVTMPDRGRYRAVMDYSEDSKIVRECNALYSGKYSKVHSAPVDIEEQHHDDSTLPRPQLIPRK